MQLRALLKALSMALIVVAPAKGLAQEAEPPAGEKGSSETEQGATELPEMTVTASPRDETSYNVPDATTATRTDTPILETPVSIQVIPQQVIRDQQAYRLEDAVKNVSGIQLTPLSSNQTDGFLYRGFAGSEALLRNGYRFFGTRASKLDLTNVERLEVLKGPAAVLYGQQLEPGGIINVVTKKPLATPYYSLEQEFGSYDFYQTSADATGPLTHDGALLYRFTLGYLNAGSFRDFGFQERVFLGPSLTWRPSEHTELNLSYEYTDEEHLADSGIPHLNGRPAPIPISRQFSEPEGPPNENTQHLVDFSGSHQFNDDWELRNGLQATFQDTRFNEVSGATLRDDDRTVDRDVTFGGPTSDEYLTFLDLTGRFKIAGTEHRVLVGGDYNKFFSTSDLFFNANAESTFSFPIDLFDPVYGTVDFAALQAQPPDLIQESETDWYGIYFQDQITLWDKLHILGGGRYDWITNKIRLAFLSPEFEQSKSEEEGFSPRVGLVYQPWPWLSLYGNYVESLGASNERSGTQILPPQRAQQYEVGVKTELFDGRLTSTLAFYHLTKQDIPADDLTTPDPGDSITTGEARSRGIELDISGEITDRLSLIATYAYTDTEVTRDQAQDESGNPAPDFTGHRLPNAPLHAGSLWAKYAVIPEHFELGAGVYLVGEREGNVEGDFDNSFQTAGYGRVDAFAAYHWQIGPSRLTAQLNINNLLDKEYFHSTAAFGGGAQFPGEPLTVIGSVRVEF